MTTLGSGCCLFSLSQCVQEHSAPITSITSITPERHTGTKSAKTTRNSNYSYTVAYGECSNANKEYLLVIIISEP